MFRPRVIPVLLLNKDFLVKSKNFKNYTYIGDPINAVRLFNEFRADELVFLDIAASKSKRTISYSLIKDIAEEAMMPFSVGGGITELTQIREIISLGVEKVIIGSYAVHNPAFIRDAANEFGSSTISVCIDVKKNLFGKEQVWTLNGSKPSGITPIQFAQLMQENGAGEIILQSVERDGKMNGYDLNLIKKVSESIGIPTVALGGAGNLSHLREAYFNAGANALAAGSLFVYYGPNNGVLINYPQKTDLSFYYENSSI
ncbi:MAG TPA: AglZ/HisF2 family acetamidino modification protein [Chitinophagaceae bacterium]|jgi:cyclase|nr:AglZ/HisF2 family acetamidino modification protein [Chitinophagaceae bacterium]